MSNTVFQRDGKWHYAVKTPSGSVLQTGGPFDTEELAKEAQQKAITRRREEPSTSFKPSDVNDGDAVFVGVPPAASDDFGESSAEVDGKTAAQKASENRGTLGSAVKLTDPADES